MARPLAVVDESLVLKLAEINCTQAEICAIVGVSRETLRKRFLALIEKGQETGKMSLRRAQFENALGGNATMQIWLGKQYLGQSDKTEHIVKDTSKMSDAELEAEDKRLRKGLKLA